jgi:hypothetical protein
MASIQELQSTSFAVKKAAAGQVQTSGSMSALWPERFPTHRQRTSLRSACGRSCSSSAENFQRLELYEPLRNCQKVMRAVASKVL